MKCFIKVIFLIFIFYSHLSYGQGLSNIWLLGYDTIQNQNNGRTLIDFKNGRNVSLTYQVPINFHRTCSTIADSSGNLLFYTNGFDVCNRLGEIMPNGQGLDTSSIMSFWYPHGMILTQGTLILPKPGNDSLYYLFHEAKQHYFIDTNGVHVYYPNSLYFSIINMRSDSGKGDLIVREQNAFIDTLTLGRITAVKHANGRDWWVIVYRYEGNAYIKLLITPQGIESPVYQTIGPRLQYLDLGQAIFNPQGNKYAIADAINGILFMDFNRCTGDFSNPVQISINDSSVLRGAAFSPNGRYFYVSSLKYLYQFDTWAANISASKDTVAVWDGFYSPQFPFATYFYTMQLGPDGKVYFVAPNSVKTLHVINSPDSIGDSCNVCQHCISLPTFNYLTIPNHPNYFLGAVSGSVCDTLQLGIQNAKLSLQKEKIAIYPNPASDNIQLAFTPSEKVRILEIVNVNSSIVLRSNISPWSQFHRIDISKLNEGLYLCRFVGGSSGTKFILTK